MKIEKEELLQILRQIKPAISKKDIIEELTHFIFTGHEIVTFNGKVSIRKSFESDFQCSVSGEEFYKIIDGIDSQEIILEKDKGYLFIKGGNTIGKIAIVDNLDILEKIEIDFKNNKWKKVPTKFREALNFCLFSASKDLSFLMLTCCAVKENCVFSSDNFRISMYKLDGEMDDILIPLMAAIELVKFDIKKYSVDKNWIHFKTKELIIFSLRKIQGDYPTVIHFFDDLEDENMIKIELSDSIKKDINSLLFMSEGDTDLEKFIYIILEKNKLICKAENDKGWIIKESKIKYNGKEIKFKINPIFFAQILEKSRLIFISKRRAFFKEEGVFQHLMVLPV